MKKIYVYVFFLHLSIGSIFAGDASTSKIKGGYFRDKDVKKRHLLKYIECGLDTVLIKIYSGKPGSKEFYGSIVFWAEACGKEGLNFYPVINYNSFSPEDYPISVAPSGKVYKFPSYTSKKYWSEIEKCFRKIANLSRTLPAIRGIVMDFEGYGVLPTCSPKDPSYSRDAVREFLHAQGVNAPMKESNLYEWLKVNNLNSKYLSFSQDKLENILKKIRESVDSENVALSLGFLPPLLNCENWFQKALIKSWGSKTNPSLVFDEGTYRNYQKEIADRMVKLHSMNAKYLPGLSLEKPFGNNPSRVMPQVCRMALESDGYWIYTTYQLSEECALKNKFEAYKLTEGDTAEDFWASIKDANIKIRDALNSGEKVDFPIPPRRPVFSKINPEDFPVRQYEIAKSGDSTASKEFPVLRGRNAFIFCLRKGEELKALISSEKLSPIYAHGSTWAIFSDKKELLKMGKILPAENDSVQFMAPRNGVCFLLVDSSLNGFKISTKNAAVLIGKEIKLYSFAGELFLKALPSANLKLGLACPQKRETVCVEFYGADDGCLLDKKSGELNKLEFVSFSTDFIKAEFKPCSFGMLDDVILSSRNDLLLLSPVKDMPQLKEALTEKKNQKERD